MGEFYESTLNFFGIEDDPDSGIYDLWGTGKEGDYSPGIGNRWIDREYGGWGGAWDSALGWTEEVVTDVGTAAGRTTNKTFQSLTGITPVTLALLAGAGFLIYKKAMR